MTGLESGQTRQSNLIELAPGFLTETDIYSFNDAPNQPVLGTRVAIMDTEGIYSQMGGMRGLEFELDEDQTPTTSFVIKYNIQTNDLDILL